MDIIVTLKQVPDPESPKESFRIDDAAMKIEQGVNRGISPHFDYITC